MWSDRRSIIIIIIMKVLKRDVTLNAHLYDEHLQRVQVLFKMRPTLFNRKFFSPSWDGKTIHSKNNTGNTFGNRYVRSIRIAIFS